jgi:methylated-DNA-protein-cysteine methyltransferase related protein
MRGAFEMNSGPGINSFTFKAKRLIKQVPRGKVATYGQVAALAGSPLGARQVVRVLHSSSRKDNLPWHRIINGTGRISLPPGGGYEEQKALLLQEGISFDSTDRIDLDLFQWRPNKIKRH